MESAWGREIGSGRKVHVRIIPEYRGDSQRPSSIRVIANISGKIKIAEFLNELAGARNGR